jgi:1-acyl-sn-glycerol-3-phosphate acyltransferase
VTVLGRWFRRLALLAFHAGFVRPMLRFFWGALYRRRALVPQGPCLVVANHNSHLDAALLMSLFPLRRLHTVHPVAAADYFGETWLRRTMAMLFMNAIAIDRHPPAGTDPLEPMVAALERGDSLVFFPEGSRGEAGVVAPFRPGVGRLVARLPGLLVVPVFLSGPERIWPRGETMPLPLGIDVKLGKPRTYDPGADPRDIANQVRDDVLALAPPPLPKPGPRPTPPVRAIVCGIDAEANHALFLALAERLGRIDRTVGLGTSILEADAAGVREAGGRVPVVRSPLGPLLLARAFRTGGLYRGSRFADMVGRARVDEALGDGRSARFVVGDGSPIVDLLAWAEADFYSGVFDEKGLQHLMHYLSGQRKIPLAQWARFVRRAPEVWLLNTFDLAHPPVPDLVVLLTRPPALAIQRLRSRGVALEPWQNEAFLGKLQEAYRQVVGVLRKPGRVEVLEIDADETRTEEAAERIESACRALALRSGVAAEAGASP